MSSLFLIVWVALVILGVVSNIRKSIKKAAQKKPSIPRPTPTVAPATTNFVAGASMQERTAQHNLERVLEQKTLRAANAVLQAKKVQRAQTISAEVQSPLELENTILAAPVAPLLPTHDVDASRVGISVQRGIFTTKRSIRSAIIAQQILGPPLALAEQSIWNPR